jgi:phage terminase large subunit-like protein
MTLPQDLERYASDPAAFIDRYIPYNEKGQPWSLAPYQRRVLALAFRWTMVAGVMRLLLAVLLWSEIKKSGKTLLAGAIGLWWAFITGYTVVLCAANDLEQSTGRVFATMVALLEHNPELRASAKIYATEIWLSNGTIIRAIPSDYRGEAGERHSLVIYDEIWAYDSERARRLFEELAPPPTEVNAWVLIVTYAGYVGESLLLEELYQRGLAGEVLDEELNVRQADDLLMFWSHVPRQPWQLGELGEQYYARQRRLLRPNTYLRLHENRWVTAESIFLTPELWDPSVDPTHRPSLSELSDEVVAADAGIKHDTAAVVKVRRVGDTIELLDHRIWTPSPEAPIDLEETVETWILERAPHALIVYDPYQLHRSMMTLRKRGRQVREFPQTVPNLTAAGQTLFDLLKGRNLRLYPSAELRQQALNTIAVESPRGWRIAKDKTTKKIDAIVALAMACRVAMERARTDYSAAMVRLRGL